MNTKGLTKALTIDLTQYTVYEVRVGPDTRGPSKCNKCNQTFKVGEIWQRMKSPPDRDYGSYFIGVHCKCPTRAA